MKSIKSRLDEDPQDHRLPQDLNAEAMDVAAPAPSGPALTDSESQLAEWMEAIVDQDERALASLYEATFSRVFGIVERIVRDVALAEEVVEDTYFQIWRQAARFDPVRGKVLTWLLAIARSRALDALRRETRFQHEELNEEVSHETPDHAAPIDELLDLARNRADLHQALMLLGAQPRQLVSLSFFQGMSHEEIAAQTALPLGTVKSQIRRALQALRTALNERGSNLLPQGAAL